MLNKFLVITSISPPNHVLKTYASECTKHGFDFVIIGDVKSPSNFALDGCDFWSIERQKKMDFELAKIIPECHYARKNLGYLEAIRHGANVIIETDDDNIPRSSFWDERQLQKTSSVIKGHGWVNIYKYFTDNRIWPRGFPLENINNSYPAIDSIPKLEVFCPIQQGLADLNPDVDAVFRLTMDLPLNFSTKPQVIISDRTWCPFNSQNTSWFPVAYPLLYIPSYCSFRMCDIWRSFIALRICWANEWGVLFHGPTVYQERNEHNLLKDFEEEIPGYLHNAHICRELESLDIRQGKESIADNLVKCYQTMIRLGLVSSQEMNLLNAWLNDLNKHTSWL